MDRRNAGAARLLDPVWLQLRAALDRLYAEIEPDGRLGAVTVTVEDTTGTVVGYTIVVADPATTVQRRILTDERMIVETFESATLDATVPSEVT